VSALGVQAGWTTEAVDYLLLPMLNNGQEGLGSMGNDAPLACMSDRPRLVYEYFKQLFAQVTNPPLDSVREAVVMSLECMIGPEGDITDTSEASAHRFRLKSPILRLSEMDDLIAMDSRGWKTKVIDMTFGREEGAAGLAPTLTRMCAEVDQAIVDGYKLVVLSDRGAGYERVPVASLLAVGELMILRASLTEITLPFH
jgi:glutamate synthase (NADPH/NADH)